MLYCSHFEAQCVFVVLYFKMINRQLAGCPVLLVCISVAYVWPAGLRETCSDAVFVR